MLTAKDLTEEDRHRLNGHVQRILTKGAVDREHLLAELKRVLQVRLPPTFPWKTPRGKDGQDSTGRGQRDESRYAVASLGKRGYEVMFAPEPNTRWDVLQPRPDLVLMDVGLPGLDGWEATRRLKQNPATAAIPVIALTAHALASDRVNAQEVGCDEYESKPVDMSSLLTKIEALLQRTK